MKKVALFFIFSSFISILRAGTVHGTFSDNSDNETGFEVERREKGLSDFEVIMVLKENQNHFFDRTPLSGKTYEYRVLAFIDEEIVDEGALKDVLTVDPDNLPMTVRRNRSGYSNVAESTIKRGVKTPSTLQLSQTSSITTVTTEVFE